MLTFPLVAWRLVRAHDVFSVHLPQFEASLLGLLGRLANRPVILTYHCDLQLPKGWFNRIVDKVVFASNYLAGQLAHAAVAYTQFCRAFALLVAFPGQGAGDPPTGYHARAGRGSRSDLEHTRSGRPAGGGHGSAPGHGKGCRGDHRGHAAPVGGSSPAQGALCRAIQRRDG